MVLRTFVLIILKLVVGNLFMKSIIFGHLKEDITLIFGEKANYDYKYQLLDDARQKLEKLSLNFSSYNPFPSCPSAVKDTCLQFQCSNIAIRALK